MTLRQAVDGKALPLQHDREVRRLLHLDERDAGADGVRDAGRH
jgi:hypothetical protein